MKMREICRMSLCTVLVLVGISSAHPPGSEKVPLALLVAQDSRRINESILKQAGYPVDTVAQFQEAARNGKPAHIRRSALELLAVRLGQDGIPAFREALQDPDFYTRKTAGLLLGAFGDKSGVEVLHRDLATLAPRNGEPDPNLMKLQGDDLRRAKSKTYAQLHDAIRAAEALSRLGDASGLALAARLALGSEYASHRDQAIMTLANLVVEAASDKSILAGQTIDPEAVLITVAEFETTPTVLTILKGNAARLPREKSVKIYKKLITSPHLAEKDREMLKGRLWMYDREAKRQSKAQSAEPKKQ
jgi:HEAT repeat protein